MNLTTAEIKESIRRINYVCKTMTHALFHDYNIQVAYDEDIDMVTVTFMKSNPMTYDLRSTFSFDVAECDSLDALTSKVFFEIHRLLTELSGNKKEVMVMTIDFTRVKKISSKLVQGNGVEPELHLFYNKKGVLFAAVYQNRQECISYQLDGAEDVYKVMEKLVNFYNKHYKVCTER